MSWIIGKQLLVTNLIYKAIAFVILTPLVAGALRIFVAMSGTAVISDLEIAYFLIGPFGWVCAVVIGALWLAIIVIGQTSLLGILGSKKFGNTLNARRALKFAAGNAWMVTLLAARFVIWLFLLIVPFLVATGVVYWLLLSEYDINFYLTEKPREYWISVGLGFALAMAFVVLLYRMLVGWFYAIPILVFEKRSPRDAIGLSVKRTIGHRRQIVMWTMAWALLVIVLSIVGTGIVGLVGRFMIPESNDNLRMLAFAIGVLFILMALLNLIVNLLSGVIFSAMMFVLYERISPKFQEDWVGFEEDPGDGKSFRWTNGRLIAAAVVGVLVASVTATVALQDIRLNDDVKIMAHRGSSKAAPENTIAAFKRAIDDGADWIELDVQETADGSVVVLHDSDFMKTAGNKLKIWDASRQDLKDIDIGSWFGPEFAAERVPTLAEVLRICKGRIGVNIELKYYGHEEALEERVVKVVEESGMETEVMVMSLKLDGVRAYEKTSSSMDNRSVDVDCRRKP